MCYERPDHANFRQYCRLWSWKLSTKTGVDRKRRSPPKPIVADYPLGGASSLLFTKSVRGRILFIVLELFAWSLSRLTFCNVWKCTICYKLLLSNSAQGSTLAMCPLARMHFLGRRASSGHNNSFYAGPRGQWLSDRWQTHMYQFFLLTYRVSPCDGLTYKYFHLDTELFYLRVSSMKTWLTNSIRHVTKLLGLMPKLNN